MEYSFRNSAREELTVVTLADYYFTIKKGQSEENISYASILSVRIARSSSSAYRMYIQPDNHKPVVINSISYDKNGKDTDQSREYGLLVRVLHHHLKDKSSAVFSTGGSSEKIWFLAAISVIMSFAICVAADFLGFTVLNAYADSFILSITAIAVVLALNARNLPKTYEPVEIPLQFLP
ncbi:hypothetical protein BH09BAC3_BH09BAC3_03480 [soil metagenome]